jgi:hypothetical protein
MSETMSATTCSDAVPACTASITASIARLQQRMIC